jgi:hypothetical protein
VPVNGDLLLWVIVVAIPVGMWIAADRWAALMVWLNYDIYGWLGTWVWGEHDPFGGRTGARRFFRWGMRLLAVAWLGLLVVGFFAAQ